MKTMFRLLVLFLAGGGWALAAAAVHVVRAEDPVTHQPRIAIVTKSRLGFDDTYVDTRKWTMDDVPRHPDVVQGLIRVGQTAMLDHLGNGESPADLQERLGDAIQRGPTAAEPPRPQATQFSLPLPEKQRRL